MTPPLQRLLCVPLLCLVISLSACAAAATPAATTPTSSASISASSAPTTPAATPSPTAAAPTIEAEPQTGKAAAAAFKTWVKQYNAEQWDRHYQTLLSVQKRVTTAKRYAACRDKSVNPEFKWVKAVSAKHNVKTKIPGTSTTQRATVVVVRLKVGGFTLPVTAHMFYEDGAWRWSMTKPNLAGCKK